MEKKPIIDALVAKAKTGDVQALREVTDCVLGKAKENIDLTSKGNELKMLTVIKVVPMPPKEDAG